MIDITLHVDFDGDSYIREIGSYDKSLDRLRKLSDSRKTKISGRKEASKKYIAEFKKMMSHELAEIALDIAYALIDGTGGTTGNMASAWSVSFNYRSSSKGYLSSDPRKYLETWREAKLKNVSFAGEGRGESLGNIDDDDLTSSMRSNYTIYISNHAHVDYAVFNNFVIGTDEYYANEAISGGLGIEGSGITDPQGYAEQRFNEEFSKAIRRVRYALRKLL